jgi:hypothetical protein
MEIVYLLGRFHVLVLHLPIGILLLAVLLEILALRPAFRALEASLPLIWLLGAVGALVTVVLGYMHAAEGGFEGETVSLHRWSGSLLALLAFAIWAWRAELPGSFARFRGVPVVLVTGALFATGHYGGSLTHGASWLLAGNDATARPPVGHVAEADIYLDVVAPALRSRCASCHNEDKRRGQFSLASYRDLMKGGESGPVIVPHQPERSDLVRRIRLEPSHVDFMPKDGKTPLTAEQRAAIEWWIGIGAPGGGTLAQLRAPAAIERTITAALRLGAN